LIFNPVVASADPEVFEASGATPADIQTAVDAFRNFLGDNNGVGGTFPTGRREINWDGVPDAFSAPNLLPANFFNSNSPRGVVFTDVNVDDSTKIEYFDVAGNLLFSQNVLPGPTNRGSLSFLGVGFDTANVFLVRITSGDRILKTPSRDVVVMDDFIYGEPQA